MPLGIEAAHGGSTLLDWRYETDAVGNIQKITDALDGSRSRLYGYQDVAYFLNHATGPWGELAWEYDPLGNRLAETRDGGRTSYARSKRTVAGADWTLWTRTPPAPGKPITDWYDVAGNLTQEVSGERKIHFDYGDDERLSEISIDDPQAIDSKAAITYDGRGDLSEATRSEPSGAGWSDPADAARLRATYGGEMLLHRFADRLPGAADGRDAEHRSEDAYVLYFDGRPVAILLQATSTLPGQSPSSAQRILYLSTDHLGTPVLATDESGAPSWSGGFEPFGEDSTGAQDAGMFLGFPGQWSDDTFEGSGLRYNLNRWYLAAAGRYSEPDPLGVSGASGLYVYAYANPLELVDPTGLFELADLPNISPEFGNAVAGFGDELSWGASGVARRWVFGNDVVNRCSNFYGGGEAVGLGVGLVFGAETLGRHALANGARSVVGEARTFSTVSRRWHKAWGSAEELDHMFFRRALGVHEGLNLVPLSPWTNRVLLNPRNFSTGGHLCQGSFPMRQEPPHRAQ